MLTNWVKGVKKQNDLSTSAVCITSFIEGSEMPHIQKGDVVLLSSESERCQYVKDTLSTFKNHFKNINVIDIGFFRKEDPNYNIQLIQELRSGGILPVIIDKDFRWFSAIMAAIDKKGADSNMCCANSIIFSEYGLACDFIGFQRHLVEMEHLERIADHSIHSMSLGKLRAEYSEVEPILRNVNNMYFDISSMKKADAPASYNSMPSGLTSEEACQLLKYLGTASELKTCVIGGDFGRDDTTCDNIAQLIWYFLEGVDRRLDDHPSKARNIQQYLVEYDDLDHSLNFIKNEKTQRWWFKYQDDNGNNVYVPCSYGEYKDTTDGELPLRLWKHLTKMGINQ